MLYDERKIKVTDKNGNRIAEFSNKYTIQDTRTKKNLMIAPTIDIVQNGESTLDFQMLHSSEKWQQIKDPENLYECNGRIYTALNEGSIVYNGSIVEVTLVELWYLLKKKFVQAYNVDTNIEAMDTHIVKILPKSTAKLVINGVSYEDSDVKDITGQVMPRGSAGYALWAILKGTDWRLGVCDVLPDGFDASKDYGTFNVESDMKSVLENIEYIQQLYGGILDWDSKNKILNLRDERKDTEFNQWKGYSIRKNKNLKELPTITWDNNIITRLYPLGNGNLNINRVNDDKPYIDNFSYTDKIYEAYLQNSNIYDTNDEGGQKTLKFWAEQQLEKMCRPRKTINYSIVDMRATTESGFETFDINDIVKAYYTDTETGEEVFEYLRINHLNYNYFYPSSESTIEVGDKISNETELFYQIYKDNQNSAQTDYNGNLSGFDISIEIPEEFWSQYGGFGYASLTEITRLYAEKITDNTEAIAEVYVYADETFATVESFTAFVEETDEKFQYSETRITQISDALSAQIELEAYHYDKLSSEIDTTNEALASFKIYADGHFATISQLASYTTYDAVGNMISTSEASIKAYADANYASITLKATVDNINSRTQGINNQGGYLVVSSDYSSLGYTYAGQLFIYKSGLVQLDAVSLNIRSTGVTMIYAGGTLSLNGGNVQILGSNVKWSGNYLTKA